MISKDKDLHEAIVNARRCYEKYRVAMNKLYKLSAAEWYTLKRELEDKDELARM